MNICAEYFPKHSADNSYDTSYQKLYENIQPMLANTKQQPAPCPDPAFLAVNSSHLVFA